MKAKASTREDYLKRISVVLEYINNHLNEEMDLRKLAEISNFSVFHFHRIFKAYQHETLAAYITRIRVETAAQMLRNTRLSIETIAGNVGYEVPSSLSKAFKQLYNISPTVYRSNKNYYIIKNHSNMKQEELNLALKLKSPRLIELEDKQVIYIRFTGAYSELDYPGTFHKLMKFANEHQLYSENIEYIAVFHDSPKVTEAAKLRSDVCLTVSGAAKAQGEIGVKEIHGGKYAIFHYQGPYDNLEAVYGFIFEKWLPENGCELRNIPTFEKYLNNPEEEKDPEKLETEIYIPVQ